MKSKSERSKERLNAMLNDSNLSEQNENLKKWLFDMRNISRVEKPNWDSINKLLDESSDLSKLNNFYEALLLSTEVPGPQKVTVEIGWNERSWFGKILFCIKTFSPRRLLLLFMGILAFSVAYFFWLAEIPEIFVGFYKIGSFIFPFCISYLTAFIFYSLTVYYPGNKRKIKLYGDVQRAIQRINASVYYNIVHPLSQKGVLIKSERNLSELDWLIYLRQDELQNFDWQKYISQLNTSTIKEIDRLFILRDIFVEIFHTAYTLKNCEIFFIESDQLSPEKLDRKDLSKKLSSFFEVHKMLKSFLDPYEAFK